MADAGGKEFWLPRLKPPHVPRKLPRVRSIKGNIRRRCGGSERTSSLLNQRWEHQPRSSSTASGVCSRTMNRPACAGTEPRVSRLTTTIVAIPDGTLQAAG